MLIKLMQKLDDLQPPLAKACRSTEISLSAPQTSCSLLPGIQGRVCSVWVLFLATAEEFCSSLQKLGLALELRLGRIRNCMGRHRDTRHAALSVSVSVCVCVCVCVSVCVCVCVRVCVCVAIGATNTHTHTYINTRILQILVLRAKTRRNPEIRVCRILMSRWSSGPLLIGFRFQNPLLAPQYVEQLPLRLSVKVLDPLYFHTERVQVPKTSGLWSQKPFSVLFFGTRDLKYCVRGPSGIPLGP